MSGGSGGGGAGRLYSLKNRTLKKFSDKLLRPLPCVWALAVAVTDGWANQA